jgi:hypothetical protein
MRRLVETKKLQFVVDEEAITGTFFSRLTTSLTSHLVDAPGQGKE